MTNLHPKFYEDNIETEDFKNAPPFWGVWAKNKPLHWMYNGLWTHYAKYCKNPLRNVNL